MSDRNDILCKLLCHRCANLEADLVDQPTTTFSYHEACQYCFSKLFCARTNARCNISAIMRLFCIAGQPLYV